MSDTQLEPELPLSPSPTPKQSKRSSASPEAATHSAADLGPEDPSEAPIASEFLARPEAAHAPTPRQRAPRSPRATSGFPWEASPLAKFPMAELLAEIDARHARAEQLRAEAERVTAEMTAIEGELAAMGVEVEAGPAPRVQREAAAPRQPRPRNTVSLADALALAVEVRAVVSPTEAAQLVQSNGYQSTAQNFGMVVANALSKDSRFKRVNRGRYERVT